MKRWVLRVACVFLYAGVANAQCEPAWTLPNSAQTSQTEAYNGTLAPISGTITLGWQANCPTGTTYNQVEIAAGCPDSINPTCTGYVNPFSGSLGYLSQTFDVPTNATTLQYSLAPYTINQLYDNSLTLLNNGVVVGATQTNCSANFLGITDCDQILNVANAPTAATSCSPVVTAPINNVVTSGTTTVTVTANCNGTYDHIGWYFGPAGQSGTTGEVSIPYGSETTTLNTTQFPNGSYQAGAIAYLDAAGTEEVPNWSSLSFFSINNTTATPTATVISTPTPLSGMAFTEPVQGSLDSGTIAVNIADVPSGDYVKVYLPNAPVTHTCAVGIYDNAWPGGGAPFGSAGAGCSLYQSSFNYDTTILPNGPSGFYAQAINSGGGIDQSASVQFTVSNAVATATATPIFSP
jgi:hypothetical protein